MTRPHFSIVLALVLAGSLLNPGFSEETAEPEAEQKTTAAKVQTLPLGQMILSGEEIDVKIHGDGNHVIRLQGRAGIVIDEIKVTADLIDAAYASDSDLKLDLKGDVKIISSADRINATAAEAHFNFGTKAMNLKGSEQQSVKLLRGNGSQNTQIEATEIQVQFKDQCGMELKTLGAATFTETKAAQSNPFSFPGSRKQNEFEQPFGADGYDFEPARFKSQKTKKKPAGGVFQDNTTPFSRE